MSDTKRINGLDVLRGSAMTLGIVLHASISYKQGYHFGYWVFDDYDSYVFDWLYLWIISFRMQLFFLLSGFFAGFLIRKIGLHQFAYHRLKRIALPLLICYFTILPLTLFPYLYVEFNKTGDPWPQLKDFFLGFFSLRTHSGFMHLWFLQHLLVFYCLSIGFVVVTERARFSFRKWSQAPLPGKPVITSLVIATLLIGGISQLFHAPLPYIWTGFIIPIPQLLYYGAFFSMGWILEGRRSLFMSFHHYYKSFLVIGTLLSIVILYLLNMYAKLPSFSLVHIVQKMLFALQTMLLVFGFLGIFTPAFKKPSTFWRYVADSAYWVYLIHLPIVMITQLILLDSPIPGALRFPIVIVVAVLVSFLTYHYLVRSTSIGVLLNGRKISQQQRA